MQICHYSITLYIYFLSCLTLGTPGTKVNLTLNLLAPTTVGARINP